MLYDERVRLRPSDHSYVDVRGDVYMGFSMFYENFLSKKFDKEMIAYAVAKSEGCSKQSVLDKWDEKRDLGCYYDKALEDCVNPMFLENYPDIRDVVESVLAEYSDYYATFEQKVVYNEYYRIAGSPDKFGISSNRKGSTFEMSDFKVFESEDLHVHRGWLNAPLSHLPSTKFIKIALQLSYYAFQLEELTGKRCKSLFIHLINPITRTHSKVYVPYMRNDILLCLEMNREKILNLVSVTESIF